jgi:hypothetical protein
VPKKDPVKAQVDAAVAIAEKIATRSVGQSLRRHLGIAGTVRVLASVAWGRLQGEPWSTLGPPVDDRDRISRLQAGDVVLLHRAVAALAGEATALEVSREAVLAGAVPFLDALIPRLPGAGLAASAHELTRSFFNAEGNTFQSDQNTFHFEVSRCRFVELLNSVGAPQLAPLFCEADRAFFDSGARPIELHRTQTLANGGANCDFRFTAK